MNAVATGGAERTARLVIEAKCSTCGVLGNEADGSSTLGIVIAHTRATGHIVILNGTCDAPSEEEAADLAGTRR